MTDLRAAYRFVLGRNLMLAHASIFSPNVSVMITHTVHADPSSAHHSSIGAMTDIVWVDPSSAYLPSLNQLRINKEADDFCWMFVTVGFRGCPQEHGIVEMQIQDRESLAEEHEDPKNRVLAPWRHGLELLGAVELMTYDPPA